MAAGQGFKTFNTGDVLTASDVNGYLMQGVWVFANAAARTSAVTSPQEGNMSFLKDTNSLEYYSGSAWVAVDTSATVPGIIGGKNGVLNGAFDIWQRGTSNAITTTAYVADRFCGYRAVAGSTVSRQVTNDTTNLPFIQYCARVQRDSGNTSTSVILFGQPFETINSIPFAGKTVTFSFYARAGANYSAASSALAVYLNTGTGTDQNVITGSYTGNSQVINQTATLTTTWQRFSYTATLAATITELSVFFGFTPVGTAGANDWFEVTGLQLEVGSTATAFSRYSPTIQGELAACQRYYFRTPTNSGSSSYFIAGAYSTTIAVGVLVLPVPLRAAPTALETNSLRLFDFTAGSGLTAATFTISGTQSVANMAEITATYGTAAYTAGRTYLVTANGSTGYIGVSAEL